MLQPTSVLRTALFVGLLVLPLHVAAAQESARETRSVEAFTAVEFRVPGTLHLRQGSDRSVEIEAPPAVLDQFETGVDDGTLELPVDSDDTLFGGLFGDDVSVDEKVDVYVTAPTIESVSLAGSGEIVGENQIEGETFGLSVAGSGRTRLDVNAEELDVQVAGSGTTMLKGQTDALTTNIAGSGDLQAADLETRTMEVSIAGSGDVEVHVTDELDASIFGSGDVHYRGQPSVSTSSFGSGEVGPIE